MALVRFGGGVSEMRGSIAGNVFARSRAGSYARNRAVPVNPSTPDQSFVRALLAGATDNFKTLDKTQVDEWNLFAATQTRLNRLGETYTPSGKQLFTEASMNLQVLGASSSVPDLTKVMANPNLPSLDPFELVMNYDAPPAGIQDFDIQNLTSSGGTHLIVQVTQETLPTISNAKKLFRQLQVSPFASTISLVAAYTAKYPTAAADPTEGNLIHVRARAASDQTGLSSSWVYGVLTIPAVSP